jgi:hypothetical protein
VTEIKNSRHILGRRFLIRVTGEGCGRSRFVEARRYLTPWRCQAKKFNYSEQAEAFMSTLAPTTGQTIEVVAWEEAWHEDLPDASWESCPKIDLKTM